MQPHAGSVPDVLPVPVPVPVVESTENLVSPDRAGALDLEDGLK
jgi:hypothetical protein